MKMAIRSAARMLGIIALVFCLFSGTSSALAEDNASAARTVQALEIKNDRKEPIRLKGAEIFQMKWQLGAVVPTSLVADAKGNLYVSDMYDIYAVSPEGKKLWSYRHRDKNTGLKYMAFGEDGNLYAFEGSSLLGLSPLFPNEKNKKGNVLVLDKQGNKLGS